VRRQESIGVDSTASAALRTRLASVADTLSWRLDTVDKLDQWLVEHPNGLLILAPVRSPTDVGELRENAREATIVSVIKDRLDPMAYRRYLGAGASGLISQDQADTTVGLTLRAALEGLVALPTDVAASLAVRLEEMPSGLVLTSTEDRVLTLLVEGASLDEIATVVGHSQRHVRRLVARLRTVTGARNRHHVAATAARWGLGDTARPPTVHTPGATPARN
jgi:DNA-binding NarL/FixJ family response regulator